MRVLLFVIPSLARALSGDDFIRACLLMIRFWYFALTRKFFLREKTMEFPVIFNKKKITFYLRTPMDIAALEEVFLLKEYEYCPVEDPKVIIDLGGHFGDTALYYHARFPDSKIICLEPSPDNYKRLLQHTSAIPNIEAVNAAIGDSDGTIDLYIQNSSLGHSVFKRASQASAVAVRSISLKTLAEEHAIDKIDVLKFDIEGAEFSLLRSIPDEANIQFLIGELHFDLVENESPDSIKEALGKYKVSLEQLQNSERYIVTGFRKDLTW